MDSSINKFYVVLLSIIVALGGFLLGFDSAVISGAVSAYSKIFGIEQSSFWFGFSVSSLTAGSILGNFLGGILADKFGRKSVLIATATMFAFCALGTAFSQELPFFIVSRIIGGLGVGMAILVAPMYIAEVAPKKYRGMMVSINQLNIVLGISAAFFSNYFINRCIADELINWRWMLGVGIVPALAYFLLLFIVPQSPRWLVLRNRDDEAQRVLNKIGGHEYAEYTLKEIEENVKKDKNKPKTYFKQLFTKEMRLIMTIGLGIAALQQISAINAILYYSSLIFQTAGGAKDAALMQAVIIGVVNLIFTIVAMYFIDKLGRKPLLIIGLTGIIVAYLISATAFYRATYKITPEKLDTIILTLQSNKMDSDKVAEVRAGLSKMVDTKFDKEIEFFHTVKENTGITYTAVKDIVLQNSINMNALLVLIGILLFIGSFAISLGPVTWALLSEIFPNRVRGLAISVAGTFNALVSTIVITVFPIELATIGTGTSFLIFGILCAAGLIFVLKYVPETKGKSLEEIQDMLEVRERH
ncbi:MAG: sugar porter family MFS transporter [Bacteroidales bacterium]|nr:sugar porter family MFS transporter [Bacteroidales bacterium]